MSIIAIASLGGDYEDNDPLSSPKEEEEDDNIDIQVTLSRSCYVAGGTVVGTVRLAHRSSSSSCSPPPLRDAVSSIALTAVGYCRLDPRWHKETEYHKAYCSNTASPDDVLGRLFKDTPNRRNIFWASTGSVSSTSEKAWLELLNLPERTEGLSWENVQPRSIRLRQHPIKNRKAATSAEESDDTNEQENESSSSSNDELLPRMQQNMAGENHRQQQLAMSFRIDLPTNLPPTLSATSCRYTYAILVRCVVVNNKNKAEKSKYNNNNNSIFTKSVQWIQVPFVVLTTSASSPSTPSAAGGAITTINCHAFAHSAGLPFGLTSTEVFNHHPSSFASGNLTVHRGGSSFFGNLMEQHQRRRRLNNNGESSQHFQQHASLQTLRISNPAGRPVAVLTILGGTTTASSALYLCPGSRLILKLDFPQKGGGDNDNNHQNDNNNSHGGSWVPCYQVSACLQGEEIVVQPDGSRNTRARQYYLSTAHQVMDPECTETLSLDLIVPDTNSNNNNGRSNNTPFSVSTNVVDISTRCIVDLTVGVVSGSSNAAAITGYSNLRLEIPIQIGHCTSSSFLVHGDSSSGGENQEDVEDENMIMTLLALSSSPSPPNAMNGDDSDNNHNNNNSSTFRTIDIRHDLKQLALVMADQCGLSSSPPMSSSSS